jgi:hypothetical protein
MHDVYVRTHPACPAPSSQVQQWRAELFSRLDSDPDLFPVVVVGNKIDVIAAAAAKAAADTAAAQVGVSS